MTLAISSLVKIYYNQRVKLLLCNGVYTTFSRFIRNILFLDYISNKERVTRDFWLGDCCFYKQVVK